MHVCFSNINKQKNWLLKKERNATRGLLVAAVLSFIPGRFESLLLENNALLLLKFSECVFSVVGSCVTAWLNQFVAPSCQYSMPFSDQSESENRKDSRVVNTTYFKVVVVFVLTPNFCTFVFCKINHL